MVSAAGKWLWGVYPGEEAVLSYPTAELLRHCFLEAGLLNHVSLFHCQETASTVALMAEPGGMRQWELLSSQWLLAHSEKITWHIFLCFWT